MRKKLQISLFLIACLCSGCAMGPDYQRPELNIPTEYMQNVDDKRESIIIKK